MASVATKLTVDEFLAPPEKEGVKRELINGEIWSEDDPLPPSAGSPHEWAKSRLGTRLAVHGFGDGRFNVMFATCIEFSVDLALTPDLSLLLCAQPAFASQELVKNTPLICIEVVSSDLAARLQQKIGLYLSHGVAEVWILYPDTQEISIHRANHYVRALSAENTLESDLLPGFSVAVSILFQ